jgi:membrane associated rhomboid family serine protease
VRLDYKSFVIAVVVTFVVGTFISVALWSINDLFVLDIKHHIFGVVFGLLAGIVAYASADRLE